MPPSGKNKLSKKFVESAPDGLHADSELRGFCLRVRGNSRTFELRWYHHGRARRYSIGPFPFVTAEQARNEALALLTRARDGEDIAATRERERRQKGNTFNDLFERWHADHAIAHKKASSAKEDRRNYTKHLKPPWGHRPAGEITPQDVNTLLAEIAKTRPIASNRIRSLASAVFNFGVAVGTVERNPVSAVKRKGKEAARDRILSDAELGRLGKELDRDKYHPATVAVVRLLLHTACRRGEIVDLEWTELDLKEGTITLPASRSKTGKRRIPLSPEAVAILKAWPREKGAKHVFLGTRNEKGIRFHLQILENEWRQIRRAAKMPDVRLHDLRHCAASLLAELGQSSVVIKSVLGHGSLATSERYLASKADLDRKAMAALGPGMASRLSGGAKIEEAAE